MAQKRQKKAGSPAKRSKPRRKSAGGAARSGGLMQGIIGAFRRVARAERKERGRLEIILLVVLAVAVIAILLFHSASR